MITIKPLLFSLTFALLASTTAQAGEAPCKGRDATACSSDSLCAWVDGYTRKDGIKVRGYCRASGKAGNKDKVSVISPARD